MTINKVLRPFAFTAALALAAAPALAQHRGGRSQQGRSYSSGSVYRGGGVRVAPRVYSSRGYYGRPYYYARPYYTFRPHVSLGFGLWLGYPVTYPYYAAPYAPYPYPYADPYGYNTAPGYNVSPAVPSAPSYGSPAYPPPSYPYDQNAPSSAAPRGGEQYNRGGISFEITPSDAAIYMDGAYVGVAADFGPSARPLDVSTGRHRIEIRADGYRQMAFDADVRAGQVLPYQGTLQQN